MSRLISDREASDCSGSVGGSSVGSMFHSVDSICDATNTNDIIREGISAEFLQFTSNYNVRRFEHTDFIGLTSNPENSVQFICSGTFGACYKLKLKESIIRDDHNKVNEVVLKFFGYALTNPIDETGSSRKCEEELETDYMFNSLTCSARFYGYMVDSMTGFVANVPRLPTIKDMSFNGETSIGKRFPCVTVVKVSECLSYELFDYILHRYNAGLYLSVEIEVSHIFRNLIHGVSEIHKKGYIHRDLKPENVMFNDSGEIRIIDFGHAIPMQVGGIIGDYGTKEFCPPESPSYCGFESDVWAAGLILYMLLYPGRKPQTAIYRSFSDISAEARDLLEHIFIVNPKERFTCEQILGHRWITREGDLDRLEKELQCVPTEYVNNLKNIANLQNFKRLFVSLSDESRRRKNTLRHILWPDTPFSEHISAEKYEALINAFKNASRNAIPDDKSNGPVELTNIAGIINKDRFPPVYDIVNSVINYFSSSTNSVCRLPTEFSTSSTDDLSPSSPTKLRRASSIVTETGISSALTYSGFYEIMRANDMDVLSTPEVFKIFDINQSGKIDYYEYILNIASLRFDHNLSDSEEEAKMYFQIFDIDNDGLILCDEFKGVMHHLVGSNGQFNANFAEFETLFAMLGAGGNQGIDLDGFTLFYKSLILSTRSRLIAV